MDPCDAHLRRDPRAGEPARVPAEYRRPRRIARRGGCRHPRPHASTALRDLKADAARRRAGHSRSEIGTDPESPLGNLFTDVLLQAVPGAELAINNTFGGLRAPPPEGPADLRPALRNLPVRQHDRGLQPDGRRHSSGCFADRLQPVRNLPGIAGLQVRAACAEGAIRVASSAANGRQVGDNDQISVVTTDFLATGGDGIFATVTPPQGLDVEETGLMVRDVAADWFRRRGGRLREEDLVNRENPRWLVPGPMPVRCREADRGTGNGDRGSGIGDEGNGDRGSGTGGLGLRAQGLRLKA